MKYSLKASIFWIVFLYIFSFGSQVSAATFVSGYISSDTTWHAGNVYVVNGEVTVYYDTTLTIEPGAIIKFDYGTALTILGHVVANGTADNNVYFTSLRDDSVGGDTNNDGSATIPGEGNWGKITIAAGASANLNYSVIRYGGVWPDYTTVLQNGGTLSLNHSTISHNVNGLITYGGSADINGSTFTSNHYGINANGGSVSVSNSSIYNNLFYGLYNSTFNEINAENNWWGDPTGPYNLFNNSGGLGDKVTTYIDFDPWLNSPPNSASSTREPLIIVPGILGSRLNRVSDGEEVWPKEFIMLGSVDDNFLNDLKLNESGDEIIDINSSGVIKNVFSFNQYGNLIQKFKDNGYALDQDLFILPYDWRLDVSDSSGELDTLIEEALANSPTGKVNIISHSMGGLLVKDYLIRKGESGINKVIFAGTPHLGAPKAFNALNWGDDFDLKFLMLGLNKNRAKEISQNMPAVYELLPSREYISQAGSYVQDDQLTSLNYDQTGQFMTASSLLTDHRNSSLLSRADAFHQSHDGWVPQSADIYNLIGCREYDTIGSFKIDSDGSVDIDSITGDGTVPLVSADHIPGDNYYVAYPPTKINHMGLVSDDRTIELMYDIITDTAHALPVGISKQESNCDNILQQIKRLRFSTHSPVNLHVYDSLGNHTGLKSDGNIELGIPDSNFIRVGDSTFVFVPEGAYSLKIEAYGIGKFDFKIKDLSNGQVAGLVIYNDIPIDNSRLKASYNFSNINNPGLLDIDRDGDGIKDAGYSPDDTWLTYNATIQSTLADLERIYKLGWTSGTVKNSLKALLEASLPTTESIQSKGKKANGVLGTAFLKQLETEYNKGNINKQAYNIIRTDILWLLNYF